MRDSRTWVMVAVLALVAVLAGVYLFVDPDTETRGWVVPSIAVLLLLLLAGVAAGGSRGRRVIRDEEERKDG